MIGTPSLAQIRKIRFEYDKLHAVCPQCFSDNYESTCMGHVIVDLESLKDTNRCACGECHWVGICHDLVPDPDLDNLAVDN